MKKIKLMVDYFCYHLRHNSHKLDGDIDLNTPPITDIFKDELMGWAHKYDGILNMEDPASTRFESLKDKNTFIKQGYELQKKLKEELGSNYEVEYHSNY